ncbi:hypothetical protein L9F63_015498, partial [Diploptera punctata]
QDSEFRHQYIACVSLRYRFQKYNIFSQIPTQYRKDTQLCEGKNFKMQILVIKGGEK